MDDSEQLDERRSFAHVDYFPLLASQRVRNNPQPAVSPKPIDFTATSLSTDSVVAKTGEPSLKMAIWLYGDDRHQLIELVKPGTSGIEIRLMPVAELRDDASGNLRWQDAQWTSHFPLELYEDNQLRIPAGSDRGTWLSSWHTEREWMDAIHNTRYSNGVIGLTEEMLPPGQALSGVQHTGSPLLSRFEVRRRELVQADFHVFAADHWNFNVRNFNPGGNHGGFLRISTHSVWMMAGANVPRGEHIRTPYDSLNFASTLLHQLGRPAPMPDRVVDLHGNDLR